MHLVKFCLIYVPSGVCHPSPERSFFLIGGSSSSDDVLLNMVHSVVCWQKDFTFCVDAMTILSNDPKKQCLKSSASKPPLT